MGGGHLYVPHNRSSVGLTGKKDPPFESRDAGNGVGNSQSGMEMNDELS